MGLQAANAMPTFPPDSHAAVEEAGKAKKLRSQVRGTMQSVPGSLGIRTKDKTWEQRRATTKH